jgi:FAD/FMN-containing dehydrogenase
VVAPPRRVLSADWDALEEAIAGEVVLPGSPRYESVRKPAIPRFHDARPEAVVLCATPDDVAETLALARRSGLRPAPRSGGHCFAGRSSSDGIVVDVAPMSSVSATGEVATIGAGARLGHVYDALERHGVTIPAGCGPEVGIAGLTLGGGLGILGRRHGLTSDSLVGARVVLADGRVVDCDANHDEDLFWALRGAGGGNFGVVTSLAFRTVPEPAATSFDLVWPHSEAVAVMDAWQAWAPDAPDECAASLLVTASADPGEPPTVAVFGAMLGGQPDTMEVLRGLVARVRADPASASWRHAPYRDTKRHLAGRGGEDDGGEGAGHPYSKSEYFRRPLPREAIAALLEHLESGRVAGQARELDLSPWGGAYNRVPAEATAFPHREERFLLKHGVVLDPGAPDGANPESARRWLRRSWEIAHPWGTGGAYPNFPDPDLEDWSAAYYGRNRERLLRVKAAYDPDGVFRPETSTGT